MIVLGFTTVADFLRVCFPSLNVAVVPLPATPLELTDGDITLGVTMAAADTAVVLGGPVLDDNGLGLGLNSFDLTIPPTLIFEAPPANDILGCFSTDCRFCVLINEPVTVVAMGGDFFVVTSIGFKFEVMVVALGVVVGVAVTIVAVGVAALLQSDVVVLDVAYDMTGFLNVVLSFLTLPIVISSKLAISCNITFFWLTLGSS